MCLKSLDSQRCFVRFQPIYHWCIFDWELGWANIKKESIEMNVKWSNWKIYFHLPYRPRSIHSIFSRLFLVNFRSTKRVNDWWNRWENGLENVYSGFNFHQTTDKIVQFLVDKCRDVERSEMFWTDWILFIL